MASLLLQRSRPDDAELIRRIAAGDGAAFGELDDRHRRPLTRYARSLLRRSRDHDVTVGVLCRRPDANGSIADNPRTTKPGDRAGRVCGASAYLYRAPGRTFVGTVFKGQPVSLLRRDDSGAWARVVSDAHDKGWIKVSALCG
jgi:hypothetical protein